MTSASSIHKITNTSYQYYVKVLAIIADGCVLFEMEKIRK